MTKRTTWNDGELRKLYRIYRYVVIVHIRWSRASKKPQWQVSGGGCGCQAKRSWIYKADGEKNKNKIKYLKKVFTVPVFADNAKGN